MPIFTLPLWVYLPRKTKADRKIILNKNIERNLHGMVYSQVKKIFSAEMEEQMKGVIIKDAPLHIDFVIYKGTKHRCDIDNYCVLSKFGLDALKDHGVIEDDNVEYVNSVSLKYGGYDKENPRCEMLIQVLS